MRTSIILTAVIWHTVHCFTCTSQGTFPNTDDSTCQSYVFCAELPSGIFISNVYSCTAGNLYNPDLNSCVQDYVCTSVTEETTSITTSPRQDEFICVAQGRFPDYGDTTCSTYYFCYYLTNGQYYRLNYSCPQGSKFDPASQICSINYECPGNTAGSTVSTRSPSFECTAQGRFPVEDDVSCSTYYFCYYLTSGQYYKTNYSCPEGTKFDSTSQTCSTTYDCVGNTIGSTLDSSSSDVSTITPAFECTSQGRFPIEADTTCTSYYFCLYLTDGRYVRYIYTCPSNSRFDPILQTCSASYVCTSSALVTTTEISLNSALLAVRILNSKCEAQGRFPVTSDVTCRSYYSCFYINGRYIEYNYRCPNGSSFDGTLQTCSTTHACSIDTTIVPTTSSSSLETTTVTVFECIQQGRFSVVEDITCRSYYYCIYLTNGTYAFEKYTCPSGTLFDPNVQLCSQTYQCALSAENTLKILGNEVNRNATFECVSTGKFPDLRNNLCQNYYYCFSLPNGDFRQQLYGCSTGKKFDPILQICSKNYQCPLPITKEIAIDSEFKCTTEGKFLVQEDPTCQTYYYCFSLPNGRFGHQLYSCVSGHRFDPKLQLCSGSYQCLYPTTTKPSTKSRFKCPTTGKFSSEGDSACQTYYYCFFLPNGEFQKQLYACTAGEKFDPNLQTCSQNYQCEM